MLCHHQKVFGGWMTYRELMLHKRTAFHWYAFIRLPEFVNQEIFEWACAQTQKKKPQLDVSLAKFVTLEEGLCVQIMHKGCYDDEPASIEKMHAFMELKAMNWILQASITQGSPECIMKYI